MVMRFEFAKALELGLWDAVLQALLAKLSDFTSPGIKGTGVEDMIFQCDGNAMLGCVSLDSELLLGSEGALVSHVVAN